MAVFEEKLKLVKGLIEGGNIKTFQQIFIYVPRTEIAKRLGMKYGRFLDLVKDPRGLKYEHTLAIARIIKVPAIKISELIHNQVE